MQLLDGPTIYKLDPSDARALAAALLAAAGDVASPPPAEPTELPR